VRDIGGRELDAAGVGDPALRASYAACRASAARHGRTYYFATLLLPAHQRPAVHALYGFARHADDLVDDQPDTARAAADLADLELALDHPHPREPAVLSAFRHTTARYGIDPHLTQQFLASMRMDLTVTRYDSDADLDAYMAGSAAAIGLQLLPVLGHERPYDVVAPYARDLGLAFQLTNFVRDVAEDATRGRTYVPDPRGAARRARALYRSAEQGVRLLDPGSRDCVQLALTLYERILDKVEAAGFPDRRVSVGRAERLARAAPVVVRRVLPTRPTSTASA
jgi:phytoene synthase